MFKTGLLVTVFELEISFIQWFGSEIIPSVVKENKGKLLIISHTTSYQHSVLFFNIVTIFSLVVAIFQNIYKDGIFKINGDQ